MIEANPRASRTVPFVSKAIGVPLAKIACRLMLGERLADMELDDPARNPSTSRSRRPCFRSGRFPRADACSGPEMKSTGEVMGVAYDYPAAFGKAQAAAGAELPDSGAGLHLGHRRRQAGCDPARRRPARPGLPRSMATGGTATAIRRMGVPVERIRKISEGSPNVVDRIESGEVDLVINTPTGSGARADGWEIRRAAVRRGIPCITTMTGGERGPARDPGAAGGARRPCDRSRSCTAAGAPVDSGRHPSERLMERTCAPERRGRRQRAARRLRRAERADEPGPAARAVLHARRGRAAGGGQAGERPYLPRAFSYARARGRALDFLLEAIGPGTQRLAELRPGDGLGCSAPLGIGFRRARGGQGPARRRRDRRAPPAVPARPDRRRTSPVLLGFRSAAHAEAARLFAGPADRDR